MVNFVKVEGQILENMPDMLSLCVHCLTSATKTLICNFECDPVATVITANVCAL